MLKNIFKDSFSIALFSFFACAAAGPSINVSELAHDFGKMIEGDIRSYTFEYQNEGDRDLVIFKLSTSCGCLSGELSRKVLKPGEKGNLRVSFDSANFYGKQKKSVTICSNAVNNPYAKVILTANVKRVWSFEPTYVEFTSTRDGKGTKEKEIEFKIKNLHSVPVRFVNVNTNVEEFAFSKEFPVNNAAIKENESFVFKIKVHTKEKLENVRYGHIDLTVKYEDGRELKKRLGALIKKWSPRK
jgi:hypothetical protein